MQPGVLGGALQFRVASVRRVCDGRAGRPGLLVSVRGCAGGACGAGEGPPGVWRPRGAAGRARTPTAKGRAVQA